MQDAECTYVQKKQRLSRISVEEVQTHGDKGINKAAEASEAPQKPKPNVQGQQLMNKIGIADRCRFSFLLKFTRATGINQGYNCNRQFMTDEPHETFLEDDASQANQHLSMLQDSPSRSDGGKTPSTRFNSTRRADRVTEALRLQSSLIWDMFLPFCGQETESTIVLADIISFFSPENILHFVDIFWDRWNPHCLIFHRPTFNIETCPPLLLANMVLMGGCTSSYKADRRIAKSLLDIAEELVFSQPMFSTATRTVASKGIANVGDTEERIHLIQISTLQATYLICIMQKWEGSDGSKIRIQRDQFTKFVSVCTILQDGSPGSALVSKFITGNTGNGVIKSKAWSPTHYIGF